MHRKTARVLDRVHELGIYTPNRSGYPLIEIPLADHEDIDAVGQYLFDGGIYLTMAAYPLVPKDEVGFRIQITAANDDEQIERLCEVLGKINERFELQHDGHRELLRDGPPEQEGQWDDQGSGRGGVGPRGGAERGGRRRGRPLGARSTARDHPYEPAVHTARGWALENLGPTVCRQRGRRTCAPSSSIPPPCGRRKDSRTFHGGWATSMRPTGSPER